MYITVIYFLSFVFLPLKRLYFVQLSGKQAADRISMLFKLYDIYLRHSGSSETFDNFPENHTFISFAFGGKRFLSGLQKRGIADFYWDYASPKVTDPDNKASYFV